MKFKYVCIIWCDKHSYMQDDQQDDYEWSTHETIAKVGHQGDDYFEKDATWDTYMQVNGGDGCK